MAVRSVETLLDGVFTIPRSRLVPGQGDGVTLKAAMRPVLVRTDDAVVLIDTGMPSIPDAVADLHERLGPPRIAAELARRDLTIEDVTHVVVTHLHYDHAGNVDLFFDADKIVQADHLAWARDPPDPWGIGFADDAWRRVDWTTVDGEATIVDGVRAVPTPGHVPGHQSVVVDAPDGRHVVPGDAAPLARNLDRDLIPGVCFDETAAKRSLERIKDLSGTFHLYHGPEGRAVVER